MTLTEKYLRAVAAQLPAATREDVIAELRDDLMSRMEDREAALGRPLTETEEEAVLREMGHPLMVAARFGAGPHHVVGPELYPWWMFGVKTALTVLAIITVIGVIARVVLGDVDMAQAVGQGFAGAFSGAITLVGFATLAGFIIERMKDRPAFLTHWRIRDLSLFEAGVFGTAWSERAKAAVGGTLSDGTPDPAGGLSPAARAMASAAGWGVFLLWWTGAIGREFRPGALSGELVLGGVDYGLLLNETVAWIWWPMLVFAAARAAFHLIRAVTGSPVRFTALGDMAFSVASLGFIGWFWLYSPLAPVFAVDTVQTFVERVRVTVETGELIAPTIIMATTALIFAAEVFTLLGAGGRLVTGVDRRQG